MLKKLNGKTEKAEPPLRNYATFKGRPGLKRKNLSFDAALTLLKRKHRIARATWNGLYLEIRENEDEKCKEIIERTKTSTQSFRYKFDQVDILANDWMTI